MTMDAEEQKLFRKYAITARKHGGNDAYSWAVFVGNRAVYNGLQQREVLYYKRQALQIEQKKA